MPEIQLGAHTIRSHGAQVARVHMPDWFVLLFLVAIEVILNVIELFHHFVGAEMVDDLRYPLQDITGPLIAISLKEYAYSLLSPDQYRADSYAHI
ncbi:Phosphatidic acid phosphatase/chloroperoxidase, N-terminal [Artemisia annua]|uniref:Phosphatidic acid phosphatase/chloroperoxidase, N-terminal n=1 Tax=Artemisia annua TaxID=35608 RepID=A0A2U1KEU3_ARTAN|nr:Phosphatidic acid phosphatase/chloroperoxidase, N-terminal [Artemisia annua]